MNELWKRVERWFAEHLPEGELTLRAAASEDAIARAEQLLGIRFPADYRESLAVHDGQEDAPTIFLLPGVCRLGSLDSLVKCWQDDRESYAAEEVERLDWLDKTERVRQVHFHPKQIPIAGSKYWDYDRLLLDFVPGPRGHEGQVILRSDADLAFVVESFRALLEKTASGLENGTIVPAKRPVELGGEWELRYLSPRGKKPVSSFKYFAK